MKKAVIALALLLTGLTACREISGDRLYALKLDRPPTAEEWERALPRLVTVKGGRVHKETPLADIDQDTVHVTTASCHHGAALPDPVVVDLRAFYTETDLYLRLAWEDATCDDAMMTWQFDGEHWQNLGGLEDGFGLLWDAEGRFPRFTCSYACHLHDFGVAGSTFHATNEMRLAREEGWLDLWHWKAQRTGRYGFADDRYLDREGMHGDLPGSLFRENSRAAASGNGALQPFAEGDAPIYDDQGLPVAEDFRSPGSLAPGYLTERPPGGRGDVRALATWQDGRWTVILQRPLSTGDPRDVVFVPGDEAGVAFGLSIMDNTLSEHYASTTEERLVLLTKPAY